MDFFDVVNNRHSVRVFEDRPVERGLVDQMLAAAATAPSSHNSRSTSFLVVEDKATLEALSVMRESGSRLIAGAPLAIVVLGDENKTDLWVDNCSISATFLQLSATALGLGTCWVHVAKRPRSKTDCSKGMAEDYVRELLGVPDGQRIQCVVAVGYELEQML